MTLTAIHGTVIGHVQGVGFRYALRREATNLGVSGWVRNRSNGAVEFHAQGEPEALAALLRWTSIGPRGALIRGISHEEAAPLSGLDAFEIHPTEL